MEMHGLDFVSYSKSGKTIYFDGKAFQSLNGTGISGNYFDIESGNECWVSGVKKDMSDRHQFGGGGILVEKRALSQYLKIIGKTELPKSGYNLGEVDTKKPIERINEIENEKLESPVFGSELHFKALNELNESEIEFVIAELIVVEKNAKFNKGRRNVKKKRLEFEAELEKRLVKTSKINR